MTVNPFQQKRKQSFKHIAGSGKYMRDCRMGEHLPGSCSFSSSLVTQESIEIPPNKQNSFQFKPQSLKQLICTSIGNLFHNIIEIMHCASSVEEESQGDVKNDTKEDTDINWKRECTTFTIGSFKTTLHVKEFRELFKIYLIEEGEQNYLEFINKSNQWKKKYREWMNLCRDGQGSQKEIQESADLIELRESILRKAMFIITNFIEAGSPRELQGFTRYRQRVVREFVKTISMTRKYRIGSEEMEISSCNGLPPQDLFSELKYQIIRHLKWDIFPRYIRSSYFQSKKWLDKFTTCNHGTPNLPSRDGCKIVKKDIGTQGEIEKFNVEKEDILNEKWDCSDPSKLMGKRESINKTGECHRRGSKSSAPAPPCRNQQKGEHSRSSITLSGNADTLALLVTTHL